MRIRICFIVLIIGLSSSFKAQVDDPNNKLVLAPVNNLFDAMREGDSLKLRSSFHNDVRMYTSFISNEGQVILEEGSLIEFLLAVGTPHENVWDEKIWNVSVRIDDNIAHVWCDYGFYVDDKFSHCGVDAFQLVKTNGKEWQIINLIDTRKRVDCYLPEGK